MKDNELRDRFDTIEKWLSSSISSSSQVNERHWEETRNRLDRIQELAEAGRRFAPIQLPSPRIPLFVGFVIGAIIFVIGLLLGHFL